MYHVKHFIITRGITFVQPLISSIKKSRYVHHAYYNAIRTLLFITGKINKSSNLVLSGGGRCDSPGKSAKYWTYSVMETGQNKILHFENIDKWEVHLRSDMEREGMVRCLNFLISKGMTITELATDSSSSVASILGKHIT